MLWSKKDIGSEKIFGSKRNFWSKKIEGTKKIVGFSKNIRSEKFLGPKQISGLKNTFGNHSQNKIVGPKKFCVQKKLWFKKKYFGPKFF